MKPLLIKDHPEGLLLSVRVQPKASRNAIQGIHGETLKIALTAPPVDGAANKACIAFVAKKLGLPKSAVAILSGQTSRNKRLLLRIEPDAEFKTRSASLRNKLEGLCRRTPKS
ncbi:MAG: DUF167 domain-containing protein [Desulfobacterales bacterium]|nr:DUF167 domain-containing protein [Desulfobacterales bacterium]